MSKVEVNTVEPQCGTTLTLGGSGDTVALGSGASQTGFGRTGTVDWITTPKVTGDSPITGVTGKGYFLNTTAGTITLNLPAGAAGSIVSMADYAATWQTNNVTVSPNGTDKIGALNQAATLGTEGQSVTFVYVDSTQGWINTMDSTSNVRGLPPYIAATGGTPACGTISGDYKIHKFTGPGTFCVSKAALCAADNLVSYMVVAGGGGGGHERGGGGGAGGYRELVSPSSPYSASPLDGYPTPANRITVSATPYAITVGGGGAGGVTRGTPAISGGNSVFSTISSAGGGGGGSHPPVDNFGLTGGSGGGIRSGSPLGSTAGNTPPTTPAQGFPGGATNFPVSGAPEYYGSGGGGATAAGSIAAATYSCGTGGAGATTSISGSPTAYAGGGAGGANTGPSAQVGGVGGGGSGGHTTPAGPTVGSTAGGCNTGGGGGGGAGAYPPEFDGSNGGSGIVYIRYKFQ